MRFAVLLLAVLVGVTAFFLFGDRLGPTVPGEEQVPAVVSPLGMSGDDPAAAPENPVEPAMDLPTVPDEPEESLTSVTEDNSSRVPDGDFGGAELVEFHGNAMLQPVGKTPYPAVRGTIEIAVLNRGKMVPLTVNVNQGRFQVEVPARCRLRIDGGRLEDQTVRFLGFPGPFTLDETADYALIGEPIPVNTLRVFAGTQLVPLAGVTVRIGPDATTARSRGEAMVGDVLVENAASPIELPYLAADHPIWLHVSADGYATTALLVDPRESGVMDAVLWPAAELTVRVTGPNRTNLKALLLHRMEPGPNGAAPSKRHFATFGLNTPGITTDPDATIFALEGLPALPLFLEARGFDKRGRETVLGKTTIELGPNDGKTVELRTENP
ncbi:hypothetical protein Poly30_56680 [Planctomycetes bacterium Poly30]|uniref:Uncharacterized protein n=1 Tax=Saltatorellus ferox TaxID=2528018 RepID=A0A518F192_9BACT|nr:hypothetical protein Poly30_56680 [Planctomycetes bacterium Poly30]